MHILRSPSRRDNRVVDLISDVLPFGRLWYDGPGALSNAIGYAEHRSRSHHAVIRVYDGTGNMIETHEHKGDLKSRRAILFATQDLARLSSAVDADSAAKIAMIVFPGFMRESCLFAGRLDRSHTAALAQNSVFFFTVRVSLQYHCMNSE